MASRVFDSSIAHFAFHKSLLASKSLPSHACLVGLLLAGFLAWPIACGSFGCPSESDNITWLSYDRFTIGKAGPDETARECVADCGWHVFEGNNGGIGNTLQIATPDEDVVFVWAYSSFAGFRVKNGWTGETDRGIRLGDSISAFQKAYPTFTEVSSNQMVGNPDGIPVDAFFDAHGSLSELLVGGYINP